MSALAYLNVLYDSLKKFSDEVLNKLKQAENEDDGKEDALKCTKLIKDRCLSVRQKMNMVTDRLRKNSRVIPCLRRKDLGKDLKKIKWTHTIQVDVTKDVMERAMVSKGLVHNMLSHPEKYVTTTHAGWSWFMMRANSRWAVSVLPFETSGCCEIDGEIFDKLYHGFYLRLHATSDSALAVALQQTGDWGHGCRVTTRKIMELNGWQVQSDVSRWAADPTTTTAFSPTEDLQALPSATKSLISYFGKYQLPPFTETVTNPFAAVGVFERTRDHFEAIRRRREVKRAQREITNLIKRLDRRVQKVELSLCFGGSHSDGDTFVQPTTAAFTPQPSTQPALNPGYGQSEDMCATAFKFSDACP